MAVEHVVVLMLENRSFDSMLGMLRQSGPGFDGLTGTETNTWHKPDGGSQIVPVWKSPVADAAALTIPDPDPGELFTDVQRQIHGSTPAPGGADMSGFVDDYVAQPIAGAAPDPAAVMHYYTPDQLPVLSTLARAFGVSDRWHASAPCQTWPNRFFAHCATADGYVNNSPTHFPYTMPTVFERLSGVGKSWGIYFHDIPQSATLANLWFRVGGFHDFDAHFAADARAGTLPNYSFVEPRYFADPAAGTLPNDQHPPHNVGLGEHLIAAVYNAVRAGPLWPKTLLIVTYDEHGGCYDHVPPPTAVSPGGQQPDGFDFGSFGVRVPAAIVSPCIAAGSVIRPSGTAPFDHTTIIATLRKLFGFAPLTARDEAAPDLLPFLAGPPANLGPASLAAPPLPPAADRMAQAAGRPPNDLQTSLAAAAIQLPTLGVDVDAHIQRLAATRDPVPDHATVGEAAGDVAAHVRAFMGRSAVSTPTPSSPNLPG